MVIIVAVSGTSGAGKSTLMRHLAQLHGSASLLHFDDYIELGTDTDSIQSWVEAGAPADEIKTPQLAEDLHNLRAGRTVQPPGRASAAISAELILLEEPFGRARRTVAPLIDLALHLELPADIALARRSLRRAQAVSETSEPDHHAAVLQDLAAQFEAYLGPQRQAYRLAEAQARAVADLILDGLRPLPQLVAEVQESLTAHRANMSNTFEKPPRKKGEP